MFMLRRALICVFLLLVPHGRPLSAEEIPKDRPLQVGFLIVDGVYNTELTAPYDIFNHSVYATQPDGVPGMETFTVSPDGGTVTTAEGLKIVPDYSFAGAPAIDILVVPSADGSREEDLKDRRMVDWVKKVGSEARYVVSLCWGAFVLAEAGLLDGLAATTFPSDRDLLEERYPKIEVQREVSFVHHGKALTSAGGAKSFDVALYLVDHLYGEAVAQRVAGGLVIDWPPKAGTVPRVVRTDPPEESLESLEKAAQGKEISP
jgi:transcriptional regulator GlxA family with amidase domain